MGASTGMFGAVWAQAEARRVLAACGARVVEGKPALGHAHERFDEAGALAGEARDVLRALLADLVAETRQAAAAA